MRFRLAVSKSVSSLGKVEITLPEAIAVADLNQDGHADLFIGGVGSINQQRSLADPAPVIWISDGLGNLRDATSELFEEPPNTLGWGNDALIADFNNDRKNDILIIDHGREVGRYENYEFSLMRLYLSNINGKFEDSSLKIQQARNFWHGASNVADIDRDGSIDFAVSALSSAFTDIYKNDGSGNFKNISSQSISTFFDGEGTNLSSVFNSGVAGFIEASGDKFPDLIVLPYTDSSNLWSALKSDFGYILENDGTGKFDSPEKLNIRSKVGGSDLSGSYGFSSILVADFDGNQLDDFIALAENPSVSGVENSRKVSVVFYYQISPGKFIDKTLDAFGSYYLFEPFATSEYDKNGAIVSASNWHELKIRSGDFNGDQHLDIVWGFLNSSTNLQYTAIWFNDGIGNFRKGNSSDFNGMADSLAGRTIVGDFNKDSVTDLGAISVDWSQGTNDFSVLLSNPWSDDNASQVLGFNEDYYVKRYPDVLKTISDGIFSDPLSHYLSVGKAEGRFIFAPNTKIWGSNKADRVVLREGNEIANCGSGDDVVWAGKGDDIINGGLGVDKVCVDSYRQDAQIILLENGDIRLNSRDGADTLSSVERLSFLDVNIALDLLGNSGQAYRLYQAALDRTPDERGLAGWIKFMDEGGSLTTMSQQFIDSQEFRTKYGTLDDRSFVNQLYLNVLDRNGEPAGIAGWVNGLANGLSRAEVLKGFSESSENQANVIGQIKNGIPYVEWWLS